MSFRSRDRTHALPDTEPGLPRPGDALAPYAAIAVAAGLFVLGHALALRTAVALAASAALAGAVAAGWSSAQRARLRDMADHFIAAGAGTAPPARLHLQAAAQDRADPHHPAHLITEPGAGYRLVRPTSTTDE